MNARIQKLRADIAKTKTRITTLQERLGEMEQQQMELENTEIVEMVRSMTATPEELAVFIREFRANAGKAMKDNSLISRMTAAHEPANSVESGEHPHADEDANTLDEEE
jgi:TolA-binding protein